MKSFVKFLVWEDDNHPSSIERIVGENIIIHFSDDLVGVLGLGINQTYPREMVGFFEAGVLD